MQPVFEYLNHLLKLYYSDVRWGVFLKSFDKQMNEHMECTLRRLFYYLYTVLCAVLRERWGKPHAGRMCVAPLAWLVLRSNIAHNNWLYAPLSVLIGYPPKITATRTAIVPAMPIINLFRFLTFCRRVDFSMKNSSDWF